MGDGFAEGPTSPSSTLALGARADPRQLAAHTILAMHQAQARGADPLVLLSELQVGCWREHELGGRTRRPALTVSRCCSCVGGTLPPACLGIQPASAALACR